MSHEQMSDSTPATYENAMHLARYIARKHRVAVYVVSTGDALWTVSTRAPSSDSTFRIVKTH